MIAVSVILLLLLILVNGALALSELAVVNAQQARLRGRAQQGDRGAQAALELAERQGRFLATVQVGITLVGVASGALGGARLASDFAPLLADAPVVGAHAGIVAQVLVVGLITYLTLVFGELVPKRIALQDPERMARIVSRPMRVLDHVARPAVILLTKSTNLVLRLLHVDPDAGDELTEDDIRLYVTEGARRGVLEEAEQDVLESVLQMDQRSVRELMVGRDAIPWVHADAGADELRALLARGGRAILVADGSPDEPAGLLDVRALARHLLAGEPVRPRELLRPVLRVSQELHALALLGRFRRENDDTPWRAEAAVVQDADGRTLGLVTMDDLLALLVESLPVAPRGDDIVPRGDGSWLVSGHVSLHDAAQAFGIGAFEADVVLPDETVGGLVSTILGRTPRESDQIRWAGWSFEVMDMDAHRVDRVLVSRSS